MKSYGIRLHQTILIRLYTITGMLLELKQLKKSATHFIMTYIICSVYILFWDSVKPV